MKRIIGILTLSCLLFSACGKDEILQEENEKKTEETTPGGDTGGDESDDDPDSPKLVVPLHVEGRYLKNEQGKIVNLHGFTQTYSPYFNNNAWSNYDVSSCLSYNKSMVDKILAAGWKFNCTWILIGVMILRCLMCVMKDMNVSQKHVSRST